MKRIVYTAAAIVFLTLNPAAKADIISIRGDEWCPYNCDPEAAHPGYVIEIAKEVFEKAGHTVDYKILPWTRTLEKVKAGEFVGAIGAAKDDAPELIYGKKALGNSSNAFAVRIDDPFVYKKPSSLEGKSMGAINGYAYTKEMDAYIEKNKAYPKKVQLTSGDNALSSNFNKLLAKRIDVLLEDGNVLSNYIMTHKLEGKAKVAESSLPSVEIYIAFSPANPKSAEYASLLDKGIEELRASGRLHGILGKYGVKDWE